MKGLRTKETDKFNRFFELIQAEATKHDAVFFAHAGDGNDFETENIEGENMMGWLIPNDLADAAEKLWKEDDLDDDWNEFFCWATWSMIGDVVQVSFETLQMAQNRTVCRV